MKKKLSLILLSFLLCISMISCARDKIIESDEFTFEESFEKLEKGIANKYELENFELVRIQIVNPKGYGAKPVLEISGYCKQDDKMVLWFKNYKLSENDKRTLLSLNEKSDNFLIIYNEIEASLPRSISSINELNDPTFSNSSYPIRTDVPGWVIEGIYNIVF